MQNPNWPTLSVKTWPVNPPADGSLPTSAATDLTAKTRSVKITRGRQYELDQDQAGTATVVVDNSSGALTAGANSNLPMRPCQIAAAWAGVTYPLFTGYVERWPTQSDNPSRATSTLALVDLFAALTQRTVRSGMTESVVALNPTYYWPLTDSGGATAGEIASGTSANLNLISNTAAINPLTGSTPAGIGTGTVLSNDGTPAFKSNLSSTTPGQEALVTPLNVPGGIPWDLTSPWALALTFELSGDLSQTNISPLVTIANSSGNIIMGIYETATNIIADFVTPAGAQYFDAIGQTNNSAVSIIVMFDGTQLWMYGYYYGSLVWQAGGAIGTGMQQGAFLSIGYPYLNSAGKTGVNNSGGIPGIGNSGFYTPLSNFDASIGHVALWTAAGGGVPSRATLANYVTAAGSWVGETVDQRTARVLGWLGITHTSLEAGTSLLGPSAVGPTDAMADVLRQVALDDLARIFIGAEGLVYLLNRNDGQLTLKPAATLGSNIAGGEIPYTTPPVIDFDPTRIFNDVQVQQIGGLTQKAIDTTSQAAYFQRVLQLQVNQLNPADVLYCGQWLLGRYKQPTPRVESITIDIGANPGWHATILGLDLNDVVLLNHRTITAPTQSLLCQVDQIVHDIVDGSKWTVTLQLSPVLVQYGIIPAMRTTLAAAAGAGVSVISLAPLQDSAVNGAESSLPVGTVLVLDGANASTRETVTVRSVTSQPTPNSPGYTTVTVQLVSATAHAHASGSTCWEQPAAIEGSVWNDPADWAARGVLESTFRLTW